jgi:transposase
MPAYSEDLRTRILAAVDGGLSKRQAARLFGVSRSTIKRYAQQRRAPGTLAPKPRSGPRPRVIGPAQEAALRAQLVAAPAATLADHGATWERDQQVRVSGMTMHRAIARLGWTVKQRPSPPRNGLSRPAPPGTPPCGGRTRAASCSSTSPGPTGR